MKVSLADHYGMCFGVRDALRTTHELAAGQQVTVLGQLVHNPVVSEHLDSLGVQTANLFDLESAPPPGQKPSTEGAKNPRPDTDSGNLPVAASREDRVMLVTAHGASNRDRDAWKNTGHTLADTTCPLVKKAHHAIATLVAAKYFPVVIGKKDHVEVRGLTGDFPQAAVILTPEEIEALPFHSKIGVVSQTTQPLDRVTALVDAIRRRHPSAEVRFIDTVCQPTKDRQAALEKLCRENQVVIAVGGHNSNNTAQLAATARKLGATAYHIATADELEPGWFQGVETVGLSAGTSTLDETVRQVHDRLQQIAAANSATLLQSLAETLPGISQDKM